MTVMLFGLVYDRTNGLVLMCHPVKLKGGLVCFFKFGPAKNIFSIKIFIFFFTKELSDYLIKVVLLKLQCVHCPVKNVV